jgi:DNA-binding Lrp family transcriptional regulator
MKDIKNKLVPLLMKGYCSPQIARLAKKTKEPSTTLHYNLRKLENDGTIVRYKTVFNYKKIEMGFCVYVLIRLSPDEYGTPERIAKELIGFDEIESIDIITGDWEMMVKVRTKDQDAYYEFVKNVLSRKGILKMTTLTVLKQLKTEFISV